MPDLSKSKITSPSARGGVRWWTFAGIGQNRRHAKTLASVVAVRRFDALGTELDTVPPVDPVQLSASTPLSLTERERAACAEAIKFAPCVTDELLERSVLARDFG